MHWFAKRRPTDVEIHLPISPTEHFFTMVRYFAASLRMNGGAAAGSRIVVTVGGDQEPVDLQRLLPWSGPLGIEWIWLERPIYQRHIYYATAVERFRHRFAAPLVLMLDADIIVTSPLDRLLRRVRETQSFHGLIAHQSPFLAHTERTSDQWWALLAARAGLETPAFPCEYGITIPNESARYCPPYFNLGVLAAPAEMMRAVGETIYEEMAHVNGCLETFFRCQIALTLALLRKRVPWSLLRWRYNLPNVPVIERFSREIDKVHLFHYLGLNQFKKHEDFASVDSVAAFLARNDLEPINQRLQRHLRPVHERVLAA